MAEAFVPGQLVTWLTQPRGGYGYVLPVDSVHWTWSAGIRGMAHPLMAALIVGSQLIGRQVGSGYERIAPVCRGLDSTRQHRCRRR